MIGVLLVRDGTRSAIAFRFRTRTKTQSRDVSIKVKMSSWNRGTDARLLKLFSIFLPPEFREEYVEEQTANLMATESKGERLDYLLDLIMEVPRIAWEFYAERRRESAK